jgi:hypothetical protein
MTTGTATLVEHVIGATGTFSLHVRTTDIRLRGHDGDSVRIRARNGAELRRLETEQGDGLLVAHATGSTPDLDIEIPVGATVLIEGSSADLDVQGLRGDQHYRTASGDVDVRDGGGRLTVEAVSGDVDIVATAPADVVARTVSGDLALRAGPIQSLKAMTTSGDLRIAGRFDPPGPFSVETVSGDAILAPAPPPAPSPAPTPELDADALDAGDDDAADDGRMAILRALERGEIDVAEATRRLESLDAVTIGDPSDEGADHGR